MKTSLLVNQWTDLGVGPIDVEVLSATAVFVVADTVPVDLTASEFSLSAFVEPFHTFEKATHVWARALDVGGASVAYTPIGSVPLSAGEAHLGEVGGNVGKTATNFGPASSTTYTAGQIVLGLTRIDDMARVDNGTGVLFGATLALAAANTVQVDLVVFALPPAGSGQTGGAYTAGNTLQALSAADRAKVSYIVHIDDWTAIGSGASFGQPFDKAPRLFKCDDTTYPRALWVVAVARGSITLAAATDGTLTMRTARN